MCILPQFLKRLVNINVLIHYTVYLKLIKYFMSFISQINNDRIPSEKMMVAW